MATQQVNSALFKIPSRPTSGDFSTHMSVSPKSSFNRKHTIPNITYYQSELLDDNVLVTDTSEDESVSNYTVQPRKNGGRKMSSEEIINEMEKEQDAIVMRLLREIDALKEENQRLRQEQAETRRSSTRFSTSSASSKLNRRDSARGGSGSGGGAIDTISPTLNLYHQRSGSISSASSNSVLMTPGAEFRRASATDYLNCVRNPRLSVGEVSRRGSTERRTPDLECKVVRAGSHKEDTKRKKKRGDGASGESK